MADEIDGTATHEFIQARLLMETAMPPLARRVEEALRNELEAMNKLPATEARRRIAVLFERPPDLRPATGMAREIVGAGGQRLVTFLSDGLSEERMAVVAALDDYVRASERFLEPVMLRHYPRDSR